MYLMIPFSLIACVVILYYTLISLVPHKAHKLRRIPGPSIWPIIGNWHFLDKSAPWNKVSHMAHQYGPVMRLQIYFIPIVVLNSYEAIFDGLVTHGKQILSRPPLQRAEMMIPDLKDALVSPANDHWRILRRAFMNNFKFYGSGKSQLEPIILQGLQEFISELKNTRGAAIDPRPMIVRYFQQMMFAINFGKTPDSETDYDSLSYFNELSVEHVNPFGNGIEIDALPGYKELGFGKEVIKTVNKIAESGRRIWDKYGRSVEMTQKSDVFSYEDGRIHEPYFAATLKSIVDNNTDKGLVEQHAIGTMMNTFIGGVGNPISSLHFFLNILLHYPNVQAKIHNEVDAVLGCNADAIVTADFQFEMHYLRASLYELLRYTSIVPFSLPHMTNENVVIKGYDIPKGVPILFNLFHIHHDEGFWDEPFSFKPERFLDDSGQFVSAEHPNRKHLMPFGAGARVCSGKILALNRLFITFANLLLHFRVEPDPDKGLRSCDPRDSPPSLIIHGVKYTAKFIPRF